jgi:hypothetical protein
MHIHRKSSHFAALACMIIALQGCAKSTPPPSEENADPPMISMESAIPEEQPVGAYKMTVAGVDGAGASKPADLNIDLDAVDGKPFKLKMKETNFLVVGRDLNDFQRIKPEQAGPGKLKVELTFPHEGEYVCCLQFTTNDGKNYSLKTPLKIGKGQGKNMEGAASSPSKSALTPDVGQPKEVDSYTFNLVDPPEQASTTMVSMPSFRISKDKRPSSNIEAIDDKAGYAVVVKEGDLSFLRTIPITNQSASKLFQQPIMFHVKITEPGTYRMWSQFKIDGTIHTVVYTFQVKSA